MTLDQLPADCRAVLASGNTGPTPSTAAKPADKPKAEKSSAARKATTTK
jgi:hypothetical protein